MPLAKDEVRGTEADGGKSATFCVHCYQDGAFTWPDATAEQMQTFSMGVLTQRHWPTFLARMATRSIPNLARWRV